MWLISIYFICIHVCHTKSTTTTAPPTTKEMLLQQRTIVVLMVTTIFLLALFVAALTAVDVDSVVPIGEGTTTDNSDDMVGYSYGVDCSFPMHYFDHGEQPRCGNNNDVFAKERKQFYHDFMDGCYKYYDNKAYQCDDTERDRLEMSFRQPQSMVNYTNTGYEKMKAPPAVYGMIRTFWETNKHKAKREGWTLGNTYTNHWNAPTYIVGIEDSTLPGGGYEFRRQIWEAIRPVVEEWTGIEQKPVSLYGIRKYTTGAVLSPHVDRLPLVSSCIINIDQDVETPWPLEVIDRTGIAVNITLEPGEMILYESGSLIHGRPFPLQGSYYANVFVHFEPTGRPIDTTVATPENADHSYLSMLDDFYPPYLLHNSPELPVWKSEHPDGWTRPVPSAPYHQVNLPTAHSAAAKGDLNSLIQISRSTKSRRLLFQQDKNNWQPIHEAARSGHTDIIQFLIKKGADKNAITKTGQSPLHLAYKYLPAQHDTILYLVDIGAKNYFDNIVQKL